MKKFFVSALILIALLAIVDHIIGFAFGKLDAKLLDYPIDYHTAYNKLMHNIEDDVVIIGNSKARHQYNAKQIEDSIHLSTINAGKDGSRFLIQATLINGMLNRYTPKLIIWEIGDNSLSDNVLSDELDRMSDLNPFFDTDSLSRQMVLKRGENEKYKMISQCYRNNNRVLGLIKNLFQERTSDGLKGYAPVKNTGYIFPKMRNVEVESQSNPEREQLLINTLNRVLLMGGGIYVCLTPEYQRSNIVETEQWKRLIQICDSLSVPVFDYHCDERFMTDSTLFKGNTHLNSKGVEKYMGIFIPDLKKQMVKDSIIK